ncbi:putative aminoadipate reductase [Lentinula raphanica]|uniref:Aminoadipate reductase n=1 Tax=Lentinula raphanica TaxID=153919 RepID=A0AA38UIK0_9AGAR|nr:putative aminoadipate reductase [Lentinula raphanica]KAJ3965380.1 putative aminoadipate reductase [Lentinula raphanica]
MSSTTTTNATVAPSLEKFITVPELLQFHLKHNSAQPVYAFANEGQRETGSCTEITYLEFIRAIARGSRLIRADHTGTDGTVVAVLAQLDTLVYQTLVAAIIQAGFIPLLISPRVTPAAVINLMKKTGCHRILSTQSTVKELLERVKSELASSSDHATYDVQVEEIPGLQDLYPKLGMEKETDPFEEYAVSSYPKEEDIAIYLHSSGSTGLPKAVGLSHTTLIKGWAGTPIPALLRSHNIRIGAMPLPPFHAFAFMVQFIYPIFCSISVALYPPTVTEPGALPILYTPKNVLPHVKPTKSNCLMIVPAMLQAWAEDEEDVQILTQMKAVVFAGGPLSPSTGDYLVSRGVHLRSLYGGTEFGIIVDIDLDPKNDADWAWHRFPPQTNPRWVPQGDGSSELHLLNTKDHIVSIVNIEIDGTPGYATSDVFAPHPTKPGLWKIVGRVDDVIIHSSGEKTVPHPMEFIIMRSPLVQEAIMFGRQRNQAGILIEPTPGNEIDVDNQDEISKFRNKIWPFVEEANREAPAYSRVYKEMILISSPKKPFPQADKGTTLRKRVYKLYEKEIDQIYDTVDANAGKGTVPPPTSWETADVQEWLATQIQDLSGKSLSPHDDVFEHGFDSLAATILRLRVTNVCSSLPSAQRILTSITQNVIYTYPSIAALSEFLVKLVHDPSQNVGTASHEEAINEMIRRFSEGLPGTVSVGEASYSFNGKHVVLLTGSTGNLGAQLLEMLLSNEAVARVYTLNRPAAKASMLERHRERFEDKALDTSLLQSEKLVFLEGETSKPNLGLADSIYKELQESLTHVIHNAWRLDFNLSLASFEPHIRGTRHLVDLALSCRNSASLRFLFTSSIASTLSWDYKKGPYPEEVVMDPKYAVGGGYGESKYVCERILQKSGLLASSFRIGQISGGKPNGAWATSDWLPMIIKSSVTLNMLPKAIGVTSWIPMDAVAESILSVAFYEQRPPIAINLVHPHPVTWESIMEAMRQSLISLKGLKSDALRLVTFQEWYATLREVADARGSAVEVSNELPATKIPEFIGNMVEADAQAMKAGDPNFEATGLTPLDTSNIQRISERMRKLEPIGIEDTELWVKYWIQHGL